MLTIYHYQDLDVQRRQRLLARVPSVDVTQQVRGIIDDIKQRREQAVWEYVKKFDGCSDQQPFVSEEEFEQSDRRIDAELKKSLQRAYENIRDFHSVQHESFEDREVKIAGSTLGFRYQPIERAAAYVPGGSAVYPSTVLMAGVPAQLAGIQEMQLITPSDSQGKVDPSLLYCAKLVGIQKILKVGGVQGLASAAFGIFAEPVQLIVGPGNSYVTCAKTFLAATERIKIDFPAGPSEILIIADESANPRFIAADLLAQSEHGEDSKCVLVTTSTSMAQQTEQEIVNMLADPAHAPRKTIKEKSIQNHSYALITPSEAQMFEFANDFAPEHLAIFTKNPYHDFSKIKNAGSVFLGSDTPVALGDYFSGSNHILPTSGYAQVYSGLSIDTFLKRITYQQATKESIANALQPILAISQAEGFVTEHGHSVKIRVEE